MCCLLAGKQHSQLWFFDAFAAQLKPDHCILIDVGTKPTRTAIYRLVWYVPPSVSVLVRVHGVGVASRYLECFLLLHI